MMDEPLLSNSNRFWRRGALPGVLLATALLSGACGDSATPDASAVIDEGSPEVVSAPTETSAPTAEEAVAPPISAAPTTAAETTTTETTTTETTTTETTEPAPVQEPFPTAPSTPETALTMLLEAETQLADSTLDAISASNAARRQQVAYRAIGANPEWDDTVLAGVAEERREAVTDHLAARRAFISMRTKLSDTLPAWRIVAPAPKDELLSYYAEAEADSGIEWEYLAAINLVESGLGRIQGLSTAGAQGPMQFLPSTWEAYAEGDIEDPHDAIIGAGRYLAASGGPDDMGRAIFAYNHHDGYVEGVSRYAKILRDDPSAYDSLHNWEIVFASTEGEVHIPVGYLETEPVLVTDYLAR